MQCRADAVDDRRRETAVRSVEVEWRPAGEAETNVRPARIAPRIPVTSGTHPSSELDPVLTQVVGQPGIGA